MEFPPSVYKSNIDLQQNKAIPLKTFTNITFCPIAKNLLPNCSSYGYVSITQFPILGLKVIIFSILAR